MQFLKFLVEFGPLIVFFLGNAKYGIFFATGAFMVATIVSLVISRLLFKHIATMPLITGVFVMIFGGLTIWLQNETFIKLKPTIVNLMFASILFGGLYFGRLFLKLVMGEVFEMKDEGWHKLTIRWGVFFVMLAVLNEFVWRNFSTDMWVNFKVFGIMPLTLIFGISQIGLLQKYHIDFDKQTSDTE